MSEVGIRETIAYIQGKKYGRSRTFKQLKQKIKKLKTDYDNEGNILIRKSEVLKIIKEAEK